LEGDDQLFDTQKLLEDLKLDYTLFFNRLEKLGDNIRFEGTFRGYFLFNLNEEQLSMLEVFIKNYQIRLEKNTISKAES
jgi:uncharacterized protein YdiU (UPF0061 family)